MDSYELLTLIGKYSGMFVTTALGAGVGAYIGSYLKKKGENLATHEDIDKLLIQVSAVTNATKAIEAKISGELWQRQKQWELRRDVIFEALKQVTEAQAGLSREQPQDQDELTMEEIGSQDLPRFVLRSGT